jgi:hypothetical protein
MKPKIAVSDRAGELIKGLVNGAFRCGETPEGPSYHKVYRAKQRAENALRRYIAALEAAPSAFQVIGAKKPRH